MVDYSKYVTPAIAERRKQIAEIKQPHKQVQLWRGELGNKKLIKAFNTLFTDNYELTEEGHRIFNKFKSLGKLNVSGDTTYFVLGKDQRQLYQFLIYYIWVNQKFQEFVFTKEHNKKPSEEDVFRLMPIITFASTFVDKEINGDGLGDPWGDGKSRIFAIYLPDAPLLGKQMELYASKIREYAAIKNRVGEHIIILAEKESPEFTLGGLPVIDLFSNKVRAGSPIDTGARIIRDTNTRATSSSYNNSFSNGDDDDGL